MSNMKVNQTPQKIYDNLTNDQLLPPIFQYINLRRAYTAYTSTHYFNDLDENVKPAVARSLDMSFRNLELLIFEEMGEMQNGYPEGMPQKE